MRLLAHQPLGAQQFERFAKRTPAHTELLGEPGLHEPLARREGPGEDRRPHAVGDVFSEKLARLQGSHSVDSLP